MAPCEQPTSIYRQEGSRAVGVRRGDKTDFRCQRLVFGRISVEVKQIFVEPELRKRGLGKLLLDGMMQAKF